MKSITFLTANIAVLRCFECNGVSPFIKSNFDEVKRQVKRAIIRTFSKVASADWEYDKDNIEKHVNENINVQITDGNTFCVIDKIGGYIEAQKQGSVEVQNYHCWNIHITCTYPSMEIADGKKLFETIMGDLDKRNIVTKRFHTTCFIRDSDFAESPRRTYGLLYYDGRWATLDETTKWKEADI